MYEQFYGLNGRPFQLTPDPDFYFESASHKKALSYLGYGLAQSEGFIVVTGEIGAGKSTLVAHLVQGIDPQQLTVAQVVTSALDGEELIHVVAQSFGLDVAAHDKAGALGAIERFLGDEARAGRRCLLIVDECQNLDIAALEELRMLSNFQLGNYPLLQTLLLGQPEFRSLLANHPELEQLRQRIVASHHLTPLGANEVEEYVLHRLEQVGWTGNPALGEGLVEAMFAATDGIPRRVNQVMNRMLLLGAIEQRGDFDVAMLETVVAEMTRDTNNGQDSAAVHEAPTTGTGPEGPGAEVVAEMLAERDARILELEQAVAALSSAPRPRQAGSGQGQDLSSLEQRLEEQEHSLRHVLTMLIEWFEDGSSREAA